MNGPPRETLTAEFAGAGLKKRAPVPFSSTSAFYFCAGFTMRPRKRMLFVGRSTMAAR